MTARADRSESPSATTALPADVFRRIEADLSDLRYRDIPIGPTLNDLLVVSLLWGHGDWRPRTKWLNRSRRVRHYLRPRHARTGSELPQPGRVLVTWEEPTPRLDDMLLPVVGAIGADRCAVMMGRGVVPTGLPQQVPVTFWDSAAGLRPDRWRVEYRRCRPIWHRRLHDICRRYELPAGAFDLMSLGLLVASQWVERALGFLRDSKPCLVLTEYDRNFMWSCLILAARHLQIPTVTLVHGVIRPDAIGFSPVLADLIVCWGQSGKEKLVAAGEPPERVIVGGCPRLTRELPHSQEQARRRLGLNPRQRIALLATSPDWGHLELADVFCAALEAIPGATGVVRLHPAEDLDLYADVAQRHPGIRFMDNAEGTLDECLAASDVVVVRGSGVGSDALIKRLPVVVLNPVGELSGNDDELVNLAGCPLATTAEGLRLAVDQILDEDPRARLRTDAAEHYVGQLCSAYGGESARLIADVVDQVVNSSSS